MVEKADDAAGLESRFEETAKKVESFASDSLNELARLGRETRAAVAEDTRAAMSALDEAFHARTLSDAAQIHIDFLAGRARANAERAKSFFDFALGFIGERAAKPAPAPVAAAARGKR